MRICSFLIAPLLIWVGAKAMPVQAQDENLPNIYQIIATECTHTPQERSLTGFLVKGIPVGTEPIDGIVTALHGVADCKSIDAIGVDPSSIDNSVGLQLIAVDIDRDVVLLIPNVSPDPLQQKEGLMPNDQVEPSESIYVVGHPYGRVDQVQTMMDLRPPPLKKLSDLIPSTGEFKTTYDRVKERSSPSLDIDVLDIQGTLVPGYSGAPIFNSQNQVIGVANGGLKEGTTEFVWAIPWRDICWTAINQELTCPKDHKDPLKEQQRLGLLKGMSLEDVPTFLENRSIELPKDILRLEVIIGQGEKHTALEQSVLSNKEASYLLPIPPGTDLTGAEIVIRNQESTAQEVLATGQISSDDSRLHSLNENYEFYVLKQAGNLILNVFPLNLSIPEAAPFTIRGRVVNRATGKPVSDATVTVSDVTEIIKSGATDSIGYYVFADIDAALRGSSKILRVAAEGYVDYALYIKLGPIRVDDILLTPNTLVQPIGIPLVIGGNVFNNETKKPIAGATVTIKVNLGVFMPLATGTTDSKGNYTLPINISPQFEPLVVNQYGVLTIEAKGFQAYMLNIQLVSIPLPDIFLLPEVTPTPTPILPTETTTPTATPTPPTNTPTTILTSCISAPERVLFVSDRDGDLEVFVMRSDGTGQQQLTRNADRDNSPHWSPDRSKIVFVSNRDGQDDLYIMDANGQNPRRLTTETGDDPVWSPDGTRIAFSSKNEGNWEIYVINTDGTNLQRLTSNAVWDSRPSWSPDSSKIVYGSRTSGQNNAGPWDIHIVDADGTLDTLIVSNGSRNNRPAWSPNGQYIAYASDLQGNWEIYRANVDGSEPKRLTNDVAADTDVTWSPDSRCLAIVTDRTGNKDIYMMDIEGNQLRNLTRNNASLDEHPAWAQ